jgi:hypothetical protein
LDVTGLRLLPLPEALTSESHHFFGQVVGRGDEVDMVFQHNLSDQDQALVILEELPGVQQNLDGVGPGKDGEPANYRTGQEMGERVFSEPIACAFHETWLNQGGH